MRLSLTAELICSFLQKLVPDPRLDIQFFLVNHHIRRLLVVLSLSGDWLLNLLFLLCGAQVPEDHAKQTVRNQVKHYEDYRTDDAIV
jgi:hypothetical protein